MSHILEIADAGSDFVVGGDDGYGLGIILDNDDVLGASGM